MERRSIISLRNQQLAFICRQSASEGILCPSFGAFLGGSLAIIVTQSVHGIYMDVARKIFGYMRSRQTYGTHKARQKFARSRAYSSILHEYRFSVDELWKNIVIQCRKDIRELNTRNRIWSTFILISTNLWLKFCFKIILTLREHKLWI